MATNSVDGNSPATFDVRAYEVSGNVEIPTNVVADILSRHLGQNLSLNKIVTAAEDLQEEFRRRGYPQISIAISKDEIKNGVVTLNLFQTALPQIVVSGVRYYSPANEDISEYSEAGTAPSAIASTTNTPEPQVFISTKPATAAQMSEARAALLEEMAAVAVAEKDHRIHVVSTNSGPRFEVEHYIVMGNSILPPATISAALTNIDGAFGPNVSFAGIQTVVEQLQKTYHDRGYVTVVVDLPRQKLTNATVKLQVIEGRLAAINVVGNYYFSSNNVMRALPSLRTNIVINAPVLQAELNRANANQDRQIYPVVGPGPEPGTSELTLKVKDQLPVHGKIEFNNQYSPGTPPMRINTSLVGNNLWQLNQSFGVQYGFSPQDLKSDNQWDFYDEPSIAYYSAFYRIPLSNPESIVDEINLHPGSFGYNEATRQFNLPPTSGETELNLYASRTTIDTGVENLGGQTLLSTPFVREIDQQTVQQGITVNSDIGFQLSKPLPEIQGVNSTISGGLDFKIYSQLNSQTNIFTFIEYTKGPSGNLIKRTSYDYIPTPTTPQYLSYLPLELNYSGSIKNFIGMATMGLGLSANLWFDGSTRSNHVTLTGKDALHSITGSENSSGNWIVLRPSFSQEMVIHTNWVTTFRADGQWASEPLINNEQFGIGGVNSVRGYREGEAFGDTGFHLSIEQQTPPYVVGMVAGRWPLTVRGSAYMDYGTINRLHPPAGIPATVDLWGTGFGVAASVGPNWQARFLFSLPLTSSAVTTRNEPYFNFSLTAQF